MALMQVRAASYARQRVRQRPIRCLMGHPPMVQILLQRIFVLLATVVAASSVIFVLIHAAGDPVDGFLAPGTSPEVREATRARLGLDQPLLQQYATFIIDGFRGDFGESWRDRQPALTAVLERLPSTLAIAFTALVLAVGLGLTLGLATAILQPGIGQAVVRGIALAGLAVPTFWLGTIFILIFAVRLGWLPSSGSGSLQALILPSVTLALGPAAMLARLLSANLREAASRPYVHVARAKGLRSRVVWLRHTLPNAVLPSIAYVGLQAGFLISGAVVVESVFAYPGIGRLALQSAAERDLPVIHAFVVVVAVLIILLNSLADLVAQAIDPRLRTDPERAVQHG